MYGKKDMKQNLSLYIMLAIPIAFALVFLVFPMYGLAIAFKDYNIFAAGNPISAVFASKWVGLEHFINIFNRPDFLRAFRNTMIISLLKLVFVFPIPIVFAILLNELRLLRLQKTIQTIVYLPHFLSWAIVAGIFVNLLSSTGVVNSLIQSLGGDKIDFLMSNKWFRPVIVISDAWKEVGWSSIIYFAAIAGLDQECFEAAEVDGANRFQRILYVTLPGLLPTIVLMLILRVGSIMDAGFSQIFAIYNPTVYETGDIIGTYVYRMGLGKLDFSIGTAVGLFNSVIAFVLVLASNHFAKRATGKSIW